MAELARQYNKVCDVRDFEDPALIAKIHEVTGRGEARPEDRHRKLWEWAMLALYLEETGALGEDTDAVGVGAGSEAPLYWLANCCRHVLATDIYGEGEFAAREAGEGMLADPARYAPYPYREDRLEVRRMDARALGLDDASADVVFCLSSIEHVGTREDVRRAAREMARVLRPGGHLVIATELFLRFHPLDWQPLQALLRVATRGRICPDATLAERQTDCFWERELRRDVIDATGLELVQPLDTAISRESFQNVIRLDADGVSHSASGEPYPHVVLRYRSAPWTSVLLAFRKAGR